MGKKDDKKKKEEVVVEQSELVSKDNASEEELEMEEQGEYEMESGEFEQLDDS